MSQTIRAAVARPSLLVMLIMTLLLGALQGPASADGNETLGPPSIPIAAGSGVVAAGTGTSTQPADIDILVPGTPVQALLYWEGHHRVETGGDDTISVNGTSVIGTLIGGADLFFNPNYSSTYRADITGLGIITAGANSVAISGMDFDRVNNGAGILVIYDDGSQSEISLVDGNDLAYQFFPAPRTTTVAQTFTFAPETIDRAADLSMFFSSVEGQDLPGDRPSVIEITVGGTVTEMVNVLASNDGLEWDTIAVSVPVPAGVSSVTVQALSEDRLGSGLKPASLAWNAAALSIGVTPPVVGGGQGCTPGFWKNRGQRIGAWTNYADGDSYESVFAVDASFDLDLLGALRQGGGGERALGRHAVAALLNAASPEVSFLYSPAQVVALVQDAYATGEFEAVKDSLEAQNELHDNDLC